MNMRDAGSFSSKYAALVIAAIATTALLLISSQARAALNVVPLHSFVDGSEGGHPVASLTLSGSTLYGTTESGGTNDSGTIFKINTDGSGFQVLHTFTRGSEGAWIVASLILSGSTLYGTAQVGGTYNYGTIFKINTDGTGFQVLYTFTGGSDGGWPAASLALSGASLYGTTELGGTYGGGTIFKINTDGTGYQTLYNFTGGSDGGRPEASLTLSGATLYGTTSAGTIFKINTDGTGYQTLYKFTGGSDGRWPAASLTLSGSTLYGTTDFGGAYDWGTIFKIHTDGTGFQTLYSFTGCSDGSGPSCSLTLSGSTLYGTAGRGGRYNAGTIFKINTDGAGFERLYSFGGPSGGVPAASLTLSGTTFYGTTSTGTASGGGSIFYFVLAQQTGSLLQSATSTGGGWEYLSPFGFFYNNSSSWIYHQTLGWLCPYGTSLDSIWMWDPQWDGAGGWWWTSSSLFPWIYSATESEWLYYDAKDSTPGTQWFFTIGGEASTH